MDDKPLVLVIGAGMAGLAAAHTLHSAAPGAFRLRVAEASQRLGGRIHSSVFCGVLVELGATWIHGISDSPIHDLALRSGALAPLLPHERMEGDSTTVLPGGRGLPDPSLDRSVAALHHSLLDAARSPDAPFDSSLGAFLRRGLDAHRESLRGPPDLVEALFAMHDNDERICTAADELGEVDLAAEQEYREFPGEHETIAQGYSRVIQHLASALPPGTVELGRKAANVTWRPEQQHSSEGPPVRVRFEDGEIWAVDHAIVTVPLGVLKRETGLFDPDLPETKRGAIRRLGFGVVDKLFMEWEPEEGAGSGFPLLRVAAGGEGVPRWLRRTPLVAPAHTGSRVLVTWLAGKEAAEMERLGEEELLRDVNTWTSSLLTAFPEAGGKVRGVMRSRWGSDPLIGGSYCYVAVGSSGEDLDRMAEPVPRECPDAAAAAAAAAPPPPLQLLFAGEATHRSCYSTTHGAYLSGLREANRLLKHYNLLG